MSGGHAPWEGPDELDSDFISGNFGKLDEFENWPEEMAGPEYQMYRRLMKGEGAFWAKARLWPPV